MISSRIFSPRFLPFLFIGAAAGGMAGYLAVKASLGGSEAVLLIRNFEGVLAVVLLLAVALEVITRLSDPETAAWLRPLLARGLPREAHLAAVVLGAAVAAGLLWTAAALAYRAGSAAAGSWDPSPAVVRFLPMWSAAVGMAAYGALCVAIGRSRSAALALAIGYPVLLLGLMIRWVLNNPQQVEMPEIPFVVKFFFPPIATDLTAGAALENLAVASILLAVLILLAHRWIGRSA